VSLRAIVVAAILVVGAAPAAPAQVAVRYDDWEVVDQMEQVQRGLDRFIEATRPQGRPDLVTSLVGLRATATKVADAYRPPGRNAVDEVSQFLAQAKAIHVSLVVGPDASAAERSWAAVVTSLVRLGQAYRANWAADVGTWAPRRVSDQQLRPPVPSLRAAAADFTAALGHALEKDKRMDATEHARAVQLRSASSTTVRELLKRFEHYDDMSVALPRAAKAAAALKPFVDTYIGATPARPTWDSANRALSTIAEGFGLQPAEAR
jgi:hypothetical protein